MAISNANNFSNAKDMYEGRASYKEEYPKSDIQFDTGYTNRLFGKVDTLGNAIQINESFLSFFAVSYDKTNASCLNFVADAFIDCRKSYNSDLQKGKINTTSQFFKDNLPVYKGWQKQEALLTTNRNNNYRQLLDYIKQNSFKIKDFEQFSEILLKFINQKSKVFTRLGFFESALNSILTSGLALDLYEGDAGDDSFREQFILDPNYGYVSDLLASRGLRFDAQVPWRVIANLQSDNLKPFLIPYLKTADFKIQDIFDKFYVKSFEGIKFTAFQEYKDTIKAFYQGYKNIFPKYDELVFYEKSNQLVYYPDANNNSSGALFGITNKIADNCSGVIPRPVYVQDIKFVADSKEEDLYFLDLYYKTRLIETSSNFRESLKEFHAGNYKAIYLSNKKREVGVQQVLNYINYNIGTLAYRSPSLDEINLTRQGNDANM